MFFYRRLIDLEERLTAFLSLTGLEHLLFIHWFTPSSIAEVITIFDDAVYIFLRFLKSRFITHHCALQDVRKQIIRIDTR